MQLRTPDHKNNDHHQQAPSPAPPTSWNNNDNVDALLTINNNKENALVLHSPILSSILPNSNKIKKFESDVLKRQAEYTARISDLEGRLALFHTRLAVECAERGREHAFTMEEYVDGPLEHTIRTSLERIDTDFVRPIMDPKRANNNSQENNSREKQSSQSSGSEINNKVAQEDSKNTNDATAPTTTHALPNLVSIERHTNLLEAQMNHHKHVTLFHNRRQQFDTIDQACRQTLQPALALEMTKADKREGGMVRRFDSSSGEYTRLVTEMASSRVSSLGYIEKEIDDWHISDLTRAEHYLEEIQKLKERVIEEREERIRQDDLVVVKIVQEKKMLEENIFLTC